MQLDNAKQKDPGQTHTNPKLRLALALPREPNHRRPASSLPFPTATLCSIALFPRRDPARPNLTFSSPNRHRHFPASPSLRRPCHATSSTALNPAS
jgi:hypothetical protein